MKYRYIVEYDYPVAHKPPVKAELILHGDKVVTDNIKIFEDRKKGHWIGRDVDARGYCSCFECSNCGIIIYPQILLKNLDYPNCPYCLSKMEGE